MGYVVVGGVQVDERIAPDARWILSSFKVKFTAGREPGHAPAGEHPVGLALDIVPDTARGGTWDDVDALARFTEPRQNGPRLPFRWVGYNGDANHGRGDHLHLSWIGRNGPVQTLIKPGQTAPTGVTSTAATGGLVVNPDGSATYNGKHYDNWRDAVKASPDEPISELPSMVLSGAGEAAVDAIKFVGEQIWNAVGEKGKYALLLAVLVVAGVTLFGLGTTRAAGGGVNPTAVAAGLKAGARA